MNTIFIEAEKRGTAEHFFLTALMAKYFPDMEYELIHMRGVANLFNETNLNLLRSKTAEGANCLAILDADTEAKGWERRDECRTTQNKNIKRQSLAQPRWQSLQVIPPASSSIYGPIGASRPRSGRVRHEEFG